MAKIEKTITTEEPALEIDEQNRGEKERETTTHAQISDRAYSLWEERGRQNGGHAEDWEQAERELKGS